MWKIEGGWWVWQKIFRFIFHGFAFRFPHFLFIFFIEKDVAGFASVFIFLLSIFFILAFPASSLLAFLSVF